MGELIVDYFVKSKVVVVVGYWNSGVGIFVVCIYVVVGILYVVFVVMVLVYMQQGDVSVFCIVLYDGEGVCLIVDYVVCELKGVYVVVIDDSMVFGIIYVDEFVKLLMVLQGRVMGCYVVSSKIFDFNSILCSICDSYFDVVFFVGFDVQVV